LSFFLSSTAIPSFSIPWSFYLLFHSFPLLVFFLIFNDPQTGQC
jgi:hypothetical protein